MRHPIECLRNLRRPRLLVTAARHGLADYQREAVLRTALRGQICDPLPGPMAALTLLIEAEAALEAHRAGRDAAWRPAHHVLVLTALMAEARAAMQ